MKSQKIPQDVIGNIAILKFNKTIKQAQKKKIANKILKQNKNITTVLEKSQKIKGRLRKAKTKFLAGEKTKITIHNENNCKFLLNIDETYFSPRLSSHRKQTLEKIAKQIKNNSKVLIMFAGVAPWPIIFAKILKTNHPKKQVEIISNEINRKANKFAGKNIKLNKLENYIKIIPGDAQKLPTTLRSYKADIILMPRPNLKTTFLKAALKLSKPPTTIYYHGFGTKQKVLDEIKSNLKNKKYKITIQKAGEIAPYQFRFLCKINLS